MEDKYTLGGWEIHGEQNEQSFNFVHPCTGKLWLVVESPVDFIPQWIAYKLVSLVDQLSSVVSVQV